MNPEKMADCTGEERATSGKLLRLFKLRKRVQKGGEEGELTFGHAKAILALPDQHVMEDAALIVVTRAMSVRQTETWVQTKLNPEKRVKVEKPEVEEDPNVREVREQLQRSLGLKVSIEDKNGRGRVIIEYSKLEDFDTLLGQLSGPIKR